MSGSRKITLPPQEERDAVPFETGEEAWLWFARCQLTRQEGARYAQGMSLQPRGCDPDDIYRSVMGLYQAKEIAPEQIRVLGQYGTRLMPPNPFEREEQKDASLWGDALEKLFITLKNKGLA